VALFGDWRDVRSAFEDAVEKVDETRPTGTLDQREYAIAAFTIESYRRAQAFVCAECAQPVPYGQEIRCIDCKAAMHESCARRHFWPNGRPAGDDPR
jgi:hypothetical protein